MSVRELHSDIFSSTKDDGLKQLRSENGNIIIRDYTLCSLFPPQLQKTVIKMQGHVWLQKLHIYQKYAFIINIMA